MRKYLIYALLLNIIIIALIDSWGAVDKTIMFGIALICIICLFIMKVKETN